MILNTCGFIEAAKQESLDAIVDLLELKRQGKIRRVIVAGCLAERYGPELAREFAEVDAITGVLPLVQERVPQQVPLTPAHYAYVKICESCYNHCAFCAIPGIKGRFMSRRQGAILAEVRRLDRAGAREINLTGQDITAYGMDLYGEKRLAKLLRRLARQAQGVEWIRLLYLFPAHVTDELLDVIADEPRICKYLDLPLQHVSDPILRAMNRRITTAQTRRLIERVRRRIPGAYLRTSFIVGLPGEGEAEFQELLAFVREAEFERLGAFVYSPEEGTRAAAMPGQVPLTVRRRRYEQLMAVQQEIASRIQLRKRGIILRVLVDEPQKDGHNVYIGRTEFDAPDVDGVIYLHSSQALQPGDFVSAKVTDTMEYDLVGEVL